MARKGDRLAQVGTTTLRRPVHRAPAPLRPRLTVGGFLPALPAPQPSKSVGNAKKASKLSSGVVLTAGEDIKVRRRGGWGGRRSRGGFGKGRRRYMLPHACSRCTTCSALRFLAPL